jgi:hypothetical protein
MIARVNFNGVPPGNGKSPQHVAFRFVKAVIAWSLILPVLPFLPIRCFLRVLIALLRCLEEFLGETIYVIALVCKFLILHFELIPKKGQIVASDARASMFVDPPADKF